MPYQKKLVREIRCPFEYGLEVFGGKWKARILCLLANVGTMRFADISRELAGISDGVLAGAMKELLREDIVSRRSYNEIPPRVEYTLTEKGKSIVPLLQAICRWSGAERMIDEQTLLGPCRTCGHRLADSAERRSKKQ